MPFGASAISHLAELVELVSFCAWMVEVGGWSGAYTWENRRHGDRRPSGPWPCGPCVTTSRGFAELAELALGGGCWHPSTLGTQLASAQARQAASRSQQSGACHGLYDYVLSFTRLLMRINWLLPTAQPTPAPTISTPRGGAETVGLPSSGIPGAVRSLPPFPLSRCESIVVSHSVFWGLN